MIATDAIDGAGWRGGGNTNVVHVACIDFSSEERRENGLELLGNVAVWAEEGEAGTGGEVVHGDENFFPGAINPIAAKTGEATLGLAGTHGVIPILRWFRGVNMTEAAARRSRSGH